MTQNVLTNDEAVTGSKHFFAFIFVTFERYVTNLRGTFVLVLIPTHPTVHFVLKVTYSIVTPVYSMWEAPSTSLWLLLRIFCAGSWRICSLRGNHYILTRQAFIRVNEKGIFPFKGTLSQDFPTQHFKINLAHLANQERKRQILYCT
jgi:hypothetical protein